MGSEATIYRRQQKALPSPKRAGRAKFFSRTRSVKDKMAVKSGIPRIKPNSQRIKLQKIAKILKIRSNKIVLANHAEKAVP